ncbi:MAG: FAD-dependent oxidoreductase [Actinomycetota bacterium]
MKVELIEKTKEAKNIYSFIFKPENPLSWKAGQYIYYKIPHKNPDQRGIVRHFTISSAPFEKNIMLTSKFDLKSGSSFKKALLGLEPGDRIEAYNIRGKFTVDSDGQGLVFIAGGIGITPYRSILLDLEKRNNIKDIIMLYSCKSKDSVVFRELWERLEQNNKGLRVNYIYGPQLINKELIDEKVPEGDRRKFYISGPTGMVKAVEESLNELGAGKIIKDYFPGYE